MNIPRKKIKYLPQQTSVKRAFVGLGPLGWLGNWAVGAFEALDVIG